MLSEWYINTNQIEEKTEINREGFYLVCTIKVTLYFYLETGLECDEIGSEEKQKEMISINIQNK